MAQIRRPDHLPNGRLRRPAKGTEKHDVPDSLIGLNHSETCCRTTEIDFGKQMLEKELLILHLGHFQSQANSIKRQYDLMLAEDSKAATETVFAIFCKFAWHDRFHKPFVAQLFLELAEHDDEKSEYTLLLQLESIRDGLLRVLTLLGQPTAQHCGAITLLSNLSRVDSLPQEHHEAVICYLLDIGKAFWPYFTADAPYYWGSNSFCDALCDMLKAVGKLMEQQYPVNSERTFVMVNKLVISGKVSPYARLRLLEIKDLQSYNWCLSSDSEEYYRERYFEALSNKSETSKDLESNDSLTQILNDTKQSQRRVRQPRSLRQVETPCSLDSFTSDLFRERQTSLKEESQVTLSSVPVSPVDSKQLPQGEVIEEFEGANNLLLADSDHQKNQQKISKSEELHHTSETNSSADLNDKNSLMPTAVCNNKEVPLANSCCSEDHLTNSVLNGSSSQSERKGVSMNANDKALGHDEDFNIGGLHTNGHSSVDRVRKDSKGSDSSESSDSSCYEVSLNDSEWRRMNWRRRVDIANSCGCQVYINNSNLVISGTQENMKSAKRKVFEVLSAPEDRYGVLVTIPEDILTYLETETDTATFIDKLGHFSGADIKKITDNQLFVSGYRECVDCVKTCMGKMNYVLKFGDDPDMVEKTDQTDEDSTLAPLERLFRLIEMGAQTAPDRRNTVRYFKRSSSTSDMDWRKPDRHHIQRGSSCDAVPVSKMEHVADPSENEPGLSRKFLLSFSRCPQALQRPADLSLDRNEDWVPLIVLPEPWNPFERPTQSSRSFMRQKSGGFGVPKSPHSLELPNESKCLPGDKPVDHPEMKDVRAS